MLLRDSAANRGVELGPFPLETLATDPTLITLEGARARLPRPAAPPHTDNNELAAAAREHETWYAPFLTGETAADVAPVATSPHIRTKEIKGAAYYLDASHVGVCELPANAWYLDTQPELTHSHAVVVLVAHGRKPDSENVASRWIPAAAADIARLRAMEISACVAGHIRALGYDARAHVAGNTDIDFERLAVLAGIAQRQQPNGIRSPFVEHFELAVITTSYALTTDTPLNTDARVNPLANWFGINGAVSGREHRRCQRRASHLSRYPMETVKRVERPTTLILDDEIPRVPQRANFFMRARHGDLGDKAQREVSRFAYKHPLTHGMMGPLRSLVPHQDGAVNKAATSDEQHSDLQDPATNSKTLRALAYHMGVDLVGICEIPRYAWYSHRPDGSATEPYHRYAVVMLIDQGYDTMEGASGDDWISGCQSMRGYLRGAEVAGVMANFLRRLGISARAQTNADSDVLHIPLVLLAGLGELSRIGELVLNPFVGPRFKSVVLTTDLPLTVDQPIDFGLQQFCTECNKCARECPVNAIPFGDKVMFNGYEIWKPDVERCTTYRITNPKGSACGRCMKTCPLNKVVTADGALVHRIGSWLGVNVQRSMLTQWLKKLLVPLAVGLDDRLGYGTRNPVKRWWQDLEIVADKVSIPRGTNERDLDLQRDTSGKKSPVGYYHASDMPAAGASDAHPTNHKAAIVRADSLESVAAAKQRRAAGGTKPAHYIPLSEIE